MTAVVRALYNFYTLLNDEIADPRTHDWFLIRSPFTLIFILYVWIKFVTKWGPSTMRHRDPMELTKIITFYNILQMVLNSYFVYLGITEMLLGDYSFKCQPIDYASTPRAMIFARSVYYFYLLKILDLLDTVFFVLRKKNNQVSFLHTYHHGIMVVASWVAVKYFAGGHICVVGVTNAFVHVVMYFYYLLSAWDNNYKKSIWWKKHLTQLQMVQFGYYFLHFLQILLRESCGFPLWIAIIFIPQNAFIFSLFADYYYKEYYKKPRELAKKRTEAAKTE